MSKSKGRISSFVHCLKDSNRNIHNELVEVCGDQALAYFTVRRWAQLFREGRDSNEDEPRTGRPKSAICEHSIELVGEFLRNNPCCSIEEISKYTDISTGNIYHILKQDLEVRKVCARWVPYLLSEARMKQRVECCENLLQYEKFDARRLYEIVTIDETWIYYSQPKSKEKSKCWLHPGEFNLKNRVQISVPKW